MKSIEAAAVFALFSMVSAMAFASQDCSRYVASINKDLATYLSTVGPRPMKDISLDKFGNKVHPQWGNPIVKLNSYTLPESISKQLLFRITDAATKGVRTANGRLACGFKYEASDGYKTERGIMNFDVEPFSSTDQVTMYVSPGAADSGVQFRAGGWAQEIINAAVRKSLASDPKYKGQFDVVF
ncbi:hypothetical protein [Noviherbaspirillum sp.]|uniref:hypothetical protein n=1 Tax=Noviherbaspirillum sp. TaxID=1926288 RepID=UPI002FE363FE